MPERVEEVPERVEKKKGGLFGIFGKLKQKEPKKEMEVNMDLLKEVLGIMDDLLEKLPEDVIDEFSRSEDFERYEKLYTVVNEYTGKPKQKEYIDKNVKSVLSTIDNLLKKLPEDVIDEFSRSEDFDRYNEVLRIYGIT